MAAAEGAPAYRGASYEYTPLNNVDAVARSSVHPYPHDKIVNLYGVVTECTEPKATRGSEWIVHLRMTDDSLPPGAPSVDLMLFGERHHLPSVREVGDIVRLHRVKARLHQGKPQFVVSMAAKAKPTPALLLFSAADDSLTPYFQTSPSFSFTKIDQPMLRRLRAHSRGGANFNALTDYQSAITDLRTPDPSEYTHPDKKRVPFFDLQCLVLNVHWPTDATPPVMHVWDGTDAKPQPLSQSVQPEGCGVPFAHRPLPLASAVRDMPQAASPEDRWPTASFLGAVPPVGSALALVLTPEAANALGDASGLPAPGSWVKFRSLQPITVAGELQALYLHSSNWSKAAVASDLVVDAQQRHATGRVAVWEGEQMLGSQPGPHCLTRLLPAAVENHPTITLREALAYPAPARFRCCVRVTGLSPQQPCEFTLPRAALEAQFAEVAAGRGEPPPAPGPFLGSGGGGGGSHVYALTMQLTDATASLEALLVGDDGATFFHGIPPVGMSAESPEALALAARCERLVCTGGSVGRRQWRGMDGTEGGAEEEEAEIQERHGKRATWVHLSLVSYVDAKYEHALPPTQSQLEMGEGFKRFRIVDTCMP